MPTPTHTGPAQPEASYDERGCFTAAPTTPAGRLLGCRQRVVELPAQRRLVPELRREPPAAHRAHEWPTSTASRGARHQFSLTDVPYDGVHQPNEQGRRCRTCPMSTTWPHGYCSRCTELGDYTECKRCRRVAVEADPESL